MNNQRIITIVSIVAIAFLLLGLIGLIIFLIVRSRHHNSVDPEDWPFKDQDEIYFSMIVNTPNVPKMVSNSYYNIIAMDNNAPNSSTRICAREFKALNADIDFNKPGRKFKVVYNSDGTKFALQTENGFYCYPIARLDGNAGINNSVLVRPNDQYITYSFTNTISDSVWFGLAHSGASNTYILTSEYIGNQIGVLYLLSYSNQSNNFVNCFTGTLIHDFDRFGDVDAAMILGSYPSNPQPLYITNLTNPILAPTVTFPFVDGETILISIASLPDYFMYNSCSYQDSNNVVGAFLRTSNNYTNFRWKVKLSPDGRAFALMGETTNTYLKVSVSILTNTSYGLSYSQLVTDSNNPSNYPTDYTNWFTLVGSKILSLATNLSFYAASEVEVRYNCNSDGSALPIFGTSWQNGSNLIFTKYTNTNQ